MRYLLKTIGKQSKKNKIFREVNDLVQRHIDRMMRNQNLNQNWDTDEII